jgi:hypothetical protein
MRSGSSALAIVLALVWIMAGARGARGDRAEAPPPPAQVAVVLLVEGHMLFMRGGNVNRGDGAFAALGDAFEKVAASAPPGTEAAVVLYGDRPEVKQPFAPMATLDRRALGVVSDYDGSIGRDLVAGVRTSLELLADVEARKKALVIIGDGLITDFDVTRADVADLRARCATLEVDVHAIVLPLPVDTNAASVELLAGRVRRVPLSIELDTALRETLREIGSAAIATRAAPTSAPPPSGGGSRSLAWVLLVIGVAALAVVGGWAFVRRRQRVA